MSAFCWTKKDGDTGVGTSTNCSAICGSLRTVRSGMESCKILGTAITCLGIVESEALKKFISWSTKMRHRYIEDLRSELGQVLHGVPMDPSLWSRRLTQTGGRPPGGRRLLSPWREVRVLVPLLPGPDGSLQSLWGAILSTLPCERCSCCQGHADGPLCRSLRRRKTPPTGGRPLGSAIVGHAKQMSTQTCLSLLVQLVLLVLLMRTRCNRGVFIHTTARMHRITVAEHLGVRLPVSLLPWAPTSGWTEANACCISAAKKANPRPS